MNDAGANPAASPTSRREQIVKRLLAGGAIIIQVGLLYYFVVMGMQWGGIGWLANLLQGLIVLVVAVLLIWRRPLLVLPLPVLSVLVMLALHAVGLPLGPTKCSPPELSAAAELPPPPGSPPPTFQSYPHSGCTADFYSSQSGKQILDHYRMAAVNAGWQIEEPEEPDPGDVGVAPGKEPPTLAERDMRTYLSNEMVTAEVTWEPVEEGPHVRTAEPPALSDQRDSSAVSLSGPRSTTYLSRPVACLSFCLTTLPSGHACRRTLLDRAAAATEPRCAGAALLIRQRSDRR